MFQKPNQFPLQQLLRSSKARIYCSPATLACILLSIEYFHHNTHHRIYEHWIHHLQQEQAFLIQFPLLRQQYEDFLTLFLLDLQFTRKQRALALDLEQRKLRLQDLRELRLKSLQEIKIKQLQQEEMERIKREELEKQKVSRFVSLAKETKKAIRGVNDAIREMRHAQETQMSEEELKIAQRIREKNKDGLGARPQAIRALHMTVGVKEADFYQRQNDHLKSRGLPYFERMDKSLGNSIYLWYQLTYDSDAFITDIMLGHKDADSEYYRDLLKMNYKKKEKYDVLTHEETDLQIIFRKSLHSTQGIKRIVVTFTEQEETRMIVDGLKRLEPNLSAFDLPEVVLWIETISKKKKTAQTNTDALITEVKKSKYI